MVEASRVLTVYVFLAGYIMCVLCTRLRVGKEKSGLAVAGVRRLVLTYDHSRKNTLRPVLALSLSFQV